GTVIMLSNQGDGTGLASSGITNLKYFTVLSNEFCGITAALWLVFFLLGKKFPPVLKLTAASAVALTFLIIAAFLAPMYPELDLYENANLWFHLILPLTAVLELIILRTDEKIPFRYTVISALPALIYGIGYLANILLNGKGEYPDTNDWYGFLNWGYPVGIAIFAAIVLMDFAMAVLMRAVNNRINKIS
ncbi:MAG: hypothetical protein ILA17_09390, partial [Ruminococcus sp.]|nr:hypothetical protein [Ruminococcus sp.]